MTQEPAVPEGFVRVRSHVLVGRDGHFIVWERDTAAHLGNEEYRTWMRESRRVDFYVDVPIVAPVVEGKVMP